MWRGAGARPSRCELALDGFAHEIGAILVVLKTCRDAREGPGRKSGLHVLAPKSPSAHAR
jgi:hypothetical protein